MASILTGIQATGTPHLGNLLGAIQPAIGLAEEPKHRALFFIADFHALTTIKDPQRRSEYTRAIAAAWLACGLNTERTIFYRQSKIPEVCELTWYLNCVTPYPMLANAHSFKDKAGRMSEVNAGLFGYPVLMAADILLYDAEVVPVGQDQKQHLEITRSIARSFNQIFPDTFVIPEPRINGGTMKIPGTDGQKMSKSYGNTLDIFLPEEKLRKQVMSIVTDSTPMEPPKNPDTCHVYAIYKSVAPEAQSTRLGEQYRAGNFGYGQAKTELFELLLDKYKAARERFDYFMNHQEELEDLLAQGEKKARAIAGEVLHRVRTKLGF